MWKWLIKRIINEDNVEYFINLAKPYLGDIARDMAVEILEDENIIRGVVELGDGLYERYRGKIFSTLGGVQSGINRGLNAEIKGNNPIAGFIENPEGFSVTNIFKKLALGFLQKQKGGSTPQSQTTNRPGRTPEMKPI